MDIAKSFTFIMEDEKWKEKLGIGVGVVLASFVLTPVLIGILGYLIISGYGIRLLQNVRDGVEKPLPEWDRWSGDLASGFKLFVSLLIYALPAMVLMFPFIMGAALSARAETVEAVGLIFMLLGIGLIFVYALLVTIMTPGITIAFARDEQIASALRFNTIWEWTRAHLGPVIIVTLAYILASIAISFAAAVVGTLLCIVGLVVTIPLSVLLPVLVQNHLYGQLARADKVGVGPVNVWPEPPANREASPLDLDEQPPVTPAAPVDIPIGPAAPTQPTGTPPLSALDDPSLPQTPV